MRLLIDDITRFDFIRPEIVRGEVRTYYCTRRDDARLALLVLRNGRLLDELAGQTVAAGIGWDDGHPGYVHVTSRRYSKITVYGILAGTDHDATLTAVLADAPRKDR